MNKLYEAIALYYLPFLFVAAWFPLWARPEITSQSETARKFPWVDNRKSVHIRNMDRLAIVDPRDFGTVSDAEVIPGQALSFEKLDSKYWIQYGDPEAKCQVVEYFSLSCPKCLEFFKKEFPAIKSHYIDSGSIAWTLHPDPADLLTLQAMVCLDCLQPEQKVLFLEAVMDSLAKSKGTAHGSQFMKCAMEIFKNPLPNLEDLEFLQTTEAFQAAYTFVTQPNVIKVIPSLEINGHLSEAAPSRALIDAYVRDPLNVLEPPGNSS